MTYCTFEHTADIGLKVEAPDLATAFGEAAYGLTSVITGGKLARSREAPWAGDIQLTAEDPETLLVRWLSEVLYLFEVDEFLVGSAVVQINQDRSVWHLAAKLLGENYQTDRHGYGCEVKAITYHGLEVETGQPARITVIFDL